MLYVRAHLCHPPAAVFPMERFLAFFQLLFNTGPLSQLPLRAARFLLLIFGPRFGFWFAGWPTASQLFLAQRSILKDAWLNFFGPPARSLQGFSGGELFLFPAVLRVAWPCHALCFFLRAGGMILPYPSIVVARPILVATRSPEGRAHVATYYYEPSQGSGPYIRFTRIRTLPCSLVSALTIQSMIRRSVSWSLVAEAMLPRPPTHLPGIWNGQLGHCYSSMHAERHILYVYTHIPV